jgi:RNase P subunit RPR2
MTEKPGDEEDGWQLKCLKCGQRKQIEWTFRIRLDEQTQNKKVLAWCSNCRWFRRSVFEMAADGK